MVSEFNIDSEKRSLSLSNDSVSHNAGSTPQSSTLKYISLKVRKHQYYINCFYFSLLTYCLYNEDKMHTRFTWFPSRRHIMAKKSMTLHTTIEPGSNKVLSSRYVILWNSDTHPARSLTVLS